MLTIGAGLTVTDVAPLVALQPFAVTVTLKLPEPTTVIDCVVAPFDQAYVPPAGDAVSVTLPGAQNVVGPLAAIAAAGACPTVAETGFDVPLHEPFETVTL